jgi:hypothetical protein
VFSTHKFDKNSRVITKPRNFAVVKAFVSRIFLCLPLIFFSPATLPATPGIISIFAPGEFNPFEENGKFGLKNTKGEVLIPPQYDKLGWSNGKFSVVENVIGYQLKGTWGLITIDNKKITKADFLELSPGQGSVIIARKQVSPVKYLTGCINASGKILVPFQYDGLEINSFRAIVFEKAGVQFRHGLIDFANKNIIPLRYRDIYPLGSLRYAVVSFENKTAIFSEDGVQLTGFDIDSISTFKNDFAIIYQDQKQGLINRSGEIVAPPAFCSIQIDDNGEVKRKLANAWLFLEGGNKVIKEFHADSIECVGADVFKINNAGRTTLVDSKLNPLTSASFSSIGKFQEGKAKFTNNGKTGILRRNGSVAVEAVYDELTLGVDHLLARKTVDGRPQWLLLDTLGKALTTKQYLLIEKYNGKFFPALYKGYWGAIDLRGREIVACVHDSLVQSLDDYIVVKFRGQYGIINTKEEWKVTPQANRLKLLEGGNYIEFATPNQIMKSMKGEVIYFTENRIDVKDNQVIEYLPSGNVLKLNMQGVITERISKSEGTEEIFEESEGYRAIKKDDRYGFIDSRSRLRIANRYEHVKKFSEGLAPAKLLGKWGYINKEDKIAIQPVYQNVGLFANGRAIVQQKNLYGLIDKNGKVVLPIRYEKVEVLANKTISITQNDLLGLGDEKGQIILTPKYNSIEDVGNGYLIVKRDGMFGVMSTDGMSTVPLMYDDIVFDRYHNQFIAMKKSAWETVKF